MGGKIIVVEGVAKSGKTEAINLACQALADGRPLKNLRPRWTRDILVILEIDGVKVGLASKGDRPPQIEESVDELISNKCAVIVCAAHPTKMARETVQRLAAKGSFEIDWMPKEEEEDHDAANRRFAKRLVAKVLAAVAELAG
jgi:hypothetical protein